MELFARPGGSLTSASPPLALCALRAVTVQPRSALVSTRLLTRTRYLGLPDPSRSSNDQAVRTNLMEVGSNNRGLTPAALALW